MTYYIIETKYVGPNQGQPSYVDADRVEISTTPAMSNMSHEPITDGWAGTTNNRCVTARGQYATLSEAHAALDRLYPDGLRMVDETGTTDDVLETYRIGRLAPWSAEASCAWCWDEATARINADTTDAEITALINEWADAARDEANVALDRDAVERMCADLRDDARADHDD